MTQLVARLQDSGLVSRSADPNDGRVVEVGITAEGRP
jgi:DNA-binding MarR family transcriptional regulator